MTSDRELHAACERLEAAARALSGLVASRVDRAERAARGSAATAPPTPAARSPDGAVATDADVWWADLPADRREQIRRWITQRAHHPASHVDGQLDVADLLPDLQPAPYAPPSTEET